MKKSLYILFTLLILITALTSCNNKKQTNQNTEKLEESPLSDFEYKINDDDTITIKYYLGNDKYVVVPEKIENKKVTIIGKRAFTHNHYLESVVIPDSVTRIDLFAFENSRSLKKVVLSDNLEVIGYCAFNGCESLSEITLPEGLKTIQGYAFSNCKSLKHIEFPQTVNEIGELVFSESGLETIKLNEGLKLISPSLFYATNLKEIVIPDSVEEICIQAFSECQELTSVKFGKSLKKLGYHCFYNCIKLTELTFPKTIESMYDTSIKGCTSLKSIKFEGNAPDFNFTSKYPYVISGLTVHYHKEAKGFTSPEWNGYETQVW